MWTEDPDAPDDEFRRAHAASVGVYYIGVAEDRAGRVHWTVSEIVNGAREIGGTSANLADAPRAAVAEIRRRLARLDEELLALERTIGLAEDEPPHHS